MKVKCPHSNNSRSRFVSLSPSLVADIVSTHSTRSVGCLVVGEEDSLRSRQQAASLRPAIIPPNRFIVRLESEVIMAKTDSFFIRKSVTLEGSAAFAQNAIDLGAYVDALGKAVLRIHNIAVQYSDPQAGTPDLTATTNAAADFQLTTQTQSDMVIAGDNKSVIASGRIVAYNEDGSTGVPTYVSQDLDVAPQQWKSGYLIGVEQIYLGGRRTNLGWNENVVVSLIMECTSETLSKEAAMALALSQQ